MLGTISGMMEKICAGASPRCDASATSPPSKNRPVRLTSVMAKIFSKSQKIIRCRIVPTRSPLMEPAAQARDTLACAAGSKKHLLPHAPQQSLHRLDEDRHRLGAQVQLAAQGAGHLDLVEVAADCRRHLAHR